MNLLGLEETLDGLTGASGVQWYGHVLTRMKMVLKRGWILKWLEEQGVGNQK